MTRKISKTALKKYTRKYYVLGKGYAGDVYTEIDLGLLKNFKAIDKYIDKRFKIAKLAWAK